MNRDQFDNIRDSIKIVDRTVLDLKNEVLLENRAVSHNPDVPPHRCDLSEVIANIVLTHRHLEDARMRLGKAIQALDGGVSVYEPKQKARLDVETHAGLLYTNYCESVGGKAFNGDPLPDWKTFRSDPAKKVQSDAWVKIAAVDATLKA